MDSIAGLWGCGLHSHHFLAFVHENSDFNPFGCLPNILLNEDRGMCVYAFYMYMHKHIWVYMCVYVCMNVYVCVFVCALVSGCMFYVHAFVFMCGWVSAREQMSPFSHKAYVQMVSLCWWFGDANTLAISWLLNLVQSTSYKFTLNRNGYGESGATSFSYSCLHTLLVSMYTMILSCL